MKIGEDLERLQHRLGYSFKDKTLLNQALTHKSAHHKHNERMEFLGDGIVNLIVADLLYQHFPSATEGELTRARASLVNKTTLSDIALEFSLGENLHLGIGELRSGGFRRESILADALEAIIGAIYLDSDFITCRKCLEQWYATRMLVLKPKEQQKDPKTRLQEWLQDKKKPLPSYQVISIVGEPHSQFFTVSCEVEGFSQIGEGSGPSRRIAEQIAAQIILKVIDHEYK